MKFDMFFHLYRAMRALEQAANATTDELKSESRAIAINHMSNITMADLVEHLVSSAMPITFDQSSVCDSDAISAKVVSSFLLTTSNDYWPSSRCASDIVNALLDIEKTWL